MEFMGQQVFLAEKLVKILLHLLLYLGVFGFDPVARAYWLNPSSVLHIPLVNNTKT
jgi:hypothetical protein